MPCQEWRRLSYRWLRLFHLSKTLVPCMLILACVGCSPSSNIQASTTSESENAPNARTSTSSGDSSNLNHAAKMDLKITDHHKVTWADEWSIQGTLINKSPRTYRGINIRMSLFDSENRSVGKAGCWIGVLSPAAKWEFTATVSEPKAAQYRLDGIQVDAVE